ncbi:MAG: hypothetical protein A2603_10875 [Bdellovibrionales bacterium RIFOXYD1_FULL_55_31]|nr:MAG: hypothetical protein A2603_10875 [Bdellovibrionales bacterium RIFOXYD1_FULL_55_31]
MRGSWFIDCTIRVVTMLIEELDQSAFAQWDEYLGRNNQSTCYHHLAWQSVARRAYRLRTHYLLARNEIGTICGALPLVEVRGLVHAHLTNGLFGAYAPALGDTQEIRAELLRRAFELARERRVQYFVVKTVGSDQGRVMDEFVELNSWVIAVLKLDSDPERLWHGLRDKVRNCVRKAQKAGLEVRRGKEYLASFYDVLAENMHRKGSPIYGFNFMKELMSAFGDKAEIVTLWHEGRVVSGALTLDHGRTTAVPFASSRPSALHMSPNNLLYWDIIRRSCEKGMTAFDFGRSLRNSGPLSFKLGWGSDIVEQPFFIRTVKGDDFEMSSNKRRADWFVDRWKRLPRSVADALGPAVCRQVAGLL